MTHLLASMRDYSTSSQIETSVDGLSVQTVVNERLTRHRDDWHGRVLRTETDMKS